MNTKWSKLAVVVAAMVVLPSLAYGLNITVNDGMNNSGLTQVTGNEGWKNLGLTSAQLASAKAGIGIGTGAEDNEVEPGSLTGQNWDLEAIVLDSDSKTVTLIGGYNWFKGYSDTTSGDLFLAFEIPGASGEAANSIGGDNPTNPATGSYAKSTTVSDTFGYDYAFDVDWNNAEGHWNADGTWSKKSTYSVYDLNDGTALTTTSSVASHDGSDPVSYAGGSTSVLSTGTVEMSRYKDNDVNTAYGVSLTGASSDSNYWHYAVTFSLSSIWTDLLTTYGLEKGDAVNLWAHITQTCGNDSLNGYVETTAGSNVPEPSSIALLLLGVIGTVARKRFFA